MFRVGTDQLLPAAQRLVREVGQVIAGVPNSVIIRGHTDSLPYAAGRTTNNWTLSAARAESTRGALEAAGIPLARIARIEGVADRQPFVAQRPLRSPQPPHLDHARLAGRRAAASRPTTEPPAPQAGAPPARPATH